MVLYIKGFPSTGANWQNPVVIMSPMNLTLLTIKAKVVNSSEVKIGDIAEFIQANNDAGDLEDVTSATDESLTVSCVVLDTEDNFDALGADNSTANPIKATDTFTAATYIDVAILIPGMILGSRLAAAEDAIAKIGLDLYSAGAGALKLVDGGLYTNRLGRMLSQAAVVAAIQWIVWLVTY